MPQKRPRFPPEYVALSLDDACTLEAPCFNKPDLLGLWGRYGLKTRKYSITATEDVKNEKGYENRSGIHSRDSSCAELMSERTPVHYAPFILKWPHPAVLDFLVQQAHTPFDPCLNSCSLLGMPSLNVPGRALEDEIVAARVLSLVQECFIPVIRGVHLHLSSQVLVCASLIAVTSG
jgi:hypothetical protein